RSTGPGAGSGRHGALDAPAGFQNVAKAFTRVIPAATSGHTGWATEPLGKLGTFTVRITVDADGKLTDLAYPADARPLVRAMLESARILLQAGQFAFWGDSIAGTETLALELSLEQREPQEQIELGHELPTPDRPGRAYFTLPSGRHFELKVALVSPAPAPAPRPARGSR
ncbi:MAG: hypothetical protein IT373_09345, partial [Polyangiaceae bacterium]|nr:hypothetical protein [Polyangiaceae bacterium]